jgi:hypothetical protein
MKAAGASVLHSSAWGPGWEWTQQGTGRGNRERNGVRVHAPTFASQTASLRPEVDMILSASANTRRRFLRR